MRIGLLGIFLVGCMGGTGETTSSSSSSGGPGPSSGAASSSSASSGGMVTEQGFTVRVPQQRDVPCDGMFCGGSTARAQDQDHICTLRYAGRSEFIYVQAHPVSVMGFAGLQYAVDGAWHSDGTTVREITGLYEWGGNHHNDTIEADVDGFQYRYNHSSYGFGFRACQPPDCLEVYLPDGGTVQNGCDPERTLPEICVLVELDGGVPPLTDTFMRCPGDDP